MGENSLTELETIVLRYNHVAMDYLKLDNHKDTYSLLKKAEIILNSAESMPNRLKLFTITYNNLGCYYKKHKKPLVALNYLQKALELEIEIDVDSANIAGSHLNICAILSGLSRHEEALVHAKKATNLLETGQKKSESTRITMNLIVSHYNSGAELEYLARYQESLKSYQVGLEIALKGIGKTHPMVQKIEEALENIHNKIGAKYEKFALKTLSPIRSILINKHERFPSITPTIPKGKYFRTTMTPLRTFIGKSLPHRHKRNISVKPYL